MLFDTLPKSQGLRLWEWYPGVTRYIVVVEPVVYYASCHLVIL